MQKLRGFFVCTTKFSIVAFGYIKLPCYYPKKNKVAAISYKNHKHIVANKIASP